MWGGFAVVWNAMVWLQHSPILMRIWGVPFLLIGCYITIGRFFIDAYNRQRTFYAVISQRALIWRAPPAGSFTAIGTGRLMTMTFVEGLDGRGTIAFGTPDQSIGGRNRPQTPEFFQIEGAQAVFNDLQHLARGGP